MNDSERALWVDNDEGLYDLWQASKLSKKKWIEQNRALIDYVIKMVTEGKKPAHFLVYDKPKKGPLSGLGSPAGRGRPTYLYFAYGANMDATRMRQRTANAVFVKKLELTHYRLRFAGMSRTWGGGVATIIRGDAFDYVPGIVWQVTAEELTALDRFEGSAYDRESIVVDAGESVIAYIRRDARPTPVSQSYLAVLRAAYIHHRFDQRVLERAAMEPSRGGVSGLGHGPLPRRHTGVRTHVETKWQRGGEKHCVVQFMLPGGITHREPVGPISAYADDAEVVRRALVTARPRIAQKVRW